MKRTLIALAATLAFVPPVFANDAHHPDKAPATVATPKTPPPSADPALRTMQDNAKKMQSQLDRIARTKAPAERQKLLMEHMQTMRENMMLGQQVAGGAMGCPMMGDGMGMMSGAGGMMDHEGMMKRMQHMEQRINEMQSKMDQTARPASK